MENNSGFVNETLLDSSPTIFPKCASIVAAVAAVAFVFIGVIGNGLTIAALLKSPKLKMQATTWFVVSLSISDMIFCAFNMPLTATRFIYEAWIFNDTLCKIFPFIFYANFGASLFHIMLIAINRHTLISNYMLYERIYKPMNAVCMIVAVWITSFLLLLPPLLGVWGTMGLDEETFSCTIQKKNGKSPKKLLFIFGILPPFVIVSYCYIRILMRVIKSKQVLRRFQESANATHTTSSSKKDDLKLTQTMILIFVCFVLCFLPLLLVNVFDDKVGTHSSHPALHISASILAWASAVVNPIIYCVSSKSYRHAYLNLLGWNKEPHNAKGATSGAAKTNTSDL